MRFRAFNHGVLARVLVVTGDNGAAEEQARAALHLSQSCGNQIGIALPASHWASWKLQEVTLP